jgi:hypothetical protein
MSMTRELDVTTVYRADGERRPAAVSVSGARVLALLSLVVAAAWFYVTWFPVDRRLTRQILWVSLNQPIPVDWSVILPPPPPDVANPDRSPRAVPQAKPEKPDQAAFDAAVAESRATLRKLNIAMYGWLTVTTLAAAWLAMCAGAGLANWASSPQARRPVRAFAIVCAVVAVALGAWIWWSHAKGAGKPPRSVEIVLTLAVMGLGGAFSAQATLRQIALACAVAVVSLAGLAAYTWKTYGAGWPPLAARTCILLVFVFAIGLGAFCARAARWQAIVSLLAVVPACAALAAYTWSRRDPGAPATTAPAYVLFVFAVAMLVGVAAARFAGHVRGMHAIAAGLILVSSVVTLAAIAYANRQGGFPDHPPQWSTYAKAFGLQSSYAWILLAARYLGR